MRSEATHAGEEALSDRADAEDLAAFGYRQELKRTLGSFSSFAASFSYLGILTGVFQLFAFGFALAGPGVWWTWLFVFAGQFMVALCFAEMAGQFPLAGSVYQWSRRISGRVGEGASWFTGWLVIVGGIVTVASVSAAYQVLLPQIDSFFQFIGTEADIGTVATPDGAKNALLLGAGLIVFAVIINVIGIRLMTRINNVGVFFELGGTVLLIILLAIAATRGPGVVTETLGTGAAHSSGYIGALLVAALIGAYVMYGFDTAGSIAEETNRPRRVAPRMILRALASAGVCGTLLLLFAFMAVSDINSEQISTQGLTFVVKDVLGDTLGTIFLCVAVVASTVCILAVVASAVRMIFAMSRDNRLPFSRGLSKVSKRSHTPIVATLVVGAGALTLLAINVGNQSFFYALVSVAVIMFYIAYLLTTGPMLIARLRGEWPRLDHGDYFSLGAWGLPVNLLAVAYGMFMIINLAWPRVEVYGEENFFFQHAGFVFVGGVLLIGAAYYLVAGRKPAEVLPDHRVGTPTGSSRHAESAATSSR